MIEIIQKNKLEMLNVNFNEWINKFNITLVINLIELGYLILKIYKHE